MKEWKFAVAAALLTLPAVPAAAQSGWSGIGQADATGTVDHVAITAHGDPHFHELMICIDGHALRLTGVNLTFGDNHTQAISIHDRLAAGGCSRALTLNAHNQPVTGGTVTFEAATLAGGTATVQFFGR